MSSIQEIKEIAKELQLRGEEKNIIEQMDKLRKSQDEEQEARVQAEERLKLEELRTQAEERLKMEEMMTQLELAKIQEQASQRKEHNLTSGGIRSVREWESSKFKMPKIPSFVDRKDDLDSWLLRYE